MFMSIQQIYAIYSPSTDVKEVDKYDRNYKAELTVWKRSHVTQGMRNMRSHRNTMLDKIETLSGECTF
jgi:hypothetical protein